MPAVLRYTRSLLTYLGPLVRMFWKSAINDASVPARVVAKLTFEERWEQANGKEIYFDLDQEEDVTTVLPILKDKEKSNEILTRTMKDAGLDLDLERMVSAQV